MSSSSKNPQIYIGGLSRRTRTEDLEKAFNKYGKIRDVSIKGKYAFIVSAITYHCHHGVLLQEYDDYHSARDAVERMDGKSLDGEKLQVEPTSKCKINNDKLTHDAEGRGRRGPSPNDKCWTCNKYGHW